MKIKRLDLLAFGPFTKETLDLSDGKPGLHVVQGPNEAGKSSTLRALKAWLFGIEARCTDNFVHDHKQLRVGGVLETSGGEELACVRRKGNKDTLLDAGTEAPIGDDTLSKLLPGLDEKLFFVLLGVGAFAVLLPIEYSLMLPFDVALRGDTVAYEFANHELAWAFALENGAMVED